MIIYTSIQSRATVHLRVPLGDGFAEGPGWHVQFAVLELHLHNETQPCIVMWMVMCT